jgi:hypothetical protein
MADHDESTTLSWDADWVQRNTGRTLNAEQARCVDTLCSFVRPYNLALINDGWRGAVDAGSSGDDPWSDDDEPPFHAPVVFGAKYLVAHVRGDLATFDFPELTRLVLAAHRHAVRVGVSAQFYRYVSTDDEEVTGPAACLRLTLHAREHDGESGWERHPTLADLAEQALVTASSGGVE